MLRATRSRWMRIQQVHKSDTSCDDHCCTHWHRCEEHLEIKVEDAWNRFSRRSSAVNALRNRQSTMRAALL